MMDNEPVKLGFKEEPIEQIISTIVAWTGKAVMFQKTDVSNAKITLVNDTFISKERALDFIFEAFRLNGIGVVETPDSIIIETLTDLSKVQPLVVLGPDDDVSKLVENGNIVIKLFQIKRANGAVFHDLAFANGFDFALIRFFSGGVRNDDTGSGFTLFLEPLDDQAVV